MKCSSLVIQEVETQHNDAADVTRDTGSRKNNVKYLEMTADVTQRRVEEDVPAVRKK